ncbi:MAG: PSD1 domain-containing protein [Planctomycetales bacterium]|nr:PSD1 domain-containing protein [Planctomycetales bacterium]
MITASTQSGQMRTHHLCRLATVGRCLAVFLCAVVFLLARADGAEADGIAFFESKVRPLFVEHCLECHGEKKQKGGLRLDSKAGWQKGGDSGPAISPGKPDASRLLKAVRYEDEDLQMPPKKKLSDTEIAVLELWVKRGAIDPRDGATGETNPKGVDFAAARQHWAFQPVTNPVPPLVKEQRWPRSTIDRFLLAKLEANGLRPASDADRHTWLRRVSLDLTGLPPTPEEISAFVDDSSPDADERVVDRLLASRSFGERWARHWLDLVGYADQLGTANDVFAEHSWRFRDYVIAAFNADKPFDRFIREQIAGDLLPADTPEHRAAQLTATGFLVLGHLDVVEADKAKLRMDVVDQQIEKVGKVLLGMTLNCTRCHDHKFDPIRLGDYYGLAGIFGSTESVYVTGQGVWSSVLTVELPETPLQKEAREQRAREHAGKLAATKADHAAVTKRNEAVAALLKTPPATDDGKTNQAALEKELGSLQARLRELGTQIEHMEFFAPKPPRAFAVHEATQPADVRINIRANPRALGDLVPRGFVQIATLKTAPTIPGEQSGRLQLVDWLTNGDNPLTARVLVNRIWQKLFGEGLVRSVDYFGLRGETPSHPELLDHLATRFVSEGWSQKRLIRELVLSHTYHLSSVADPHATKLDPDNRLMARMNRVRLDAESLRDALLAAGGDLLPSDGGPSLPLEFAQNVGGLSPKNVNPPSFSLRKFRPEQSRIRTVYLPVVRSSAQQGPADILNFFDFAQPAQFTGQRPTTAVPTQALFLLNSPLLNEQSGKLADVLLASPVGNDRDRLAALWLRALNRPITAAEARAAAEFLAVRDTAEPAKDSDARTAWTRLCHALLISNEFLFRF